MKLQPRLLFAAVLISQFVSAKTFDVSPDKPDALIAERDAVRAWRAAGHSNDVAIIQLKRGDYTLTQPLVLDAQDGNMTWYARDPEDTVVSGGKKISGFREEGGLWVAKSDLKFEQLYVNGKHATRARMPDADYFHAGELTHMKQPDGREKITMKMPDDVIAALPTNAAALHEVNILLLHKWDNTRAFISEVDRDAKTATFENVKWKPWNQWTEKARFSVENFRGALNEAGEWFLDRDGTLFYKPRPGEKISSAEIIAPVVDKLIEIKGASHVRFDGIKFGNAGYHVPADGNDPMQAAAYIEAAIMVDDATDVQFENCEVANVATYGIWFRRGCSDGLIRHCVIEDLGAGGVRIGETSHGEITSATEEITVDNNIIRGCGWFHPSCCALIIGQSPNNRVTHNDISDTTYTAISVGWTWGYGPHRGTNNFIGYNRVHKIAQGMLSDLGGIYTLGIAPGSACVGNLFYDIRAHDYGGWGIYHDEGSTGWRDESNVCWNCTCVNAEGGAGFHQHYGATNHLVNNIFAFSSGNQMQATRVEDHVSLIIEHNLIINSNAGFYGSAGAWEGPWPKFHFESRSNLFVNLGANTNGFAHKDFAAWQAAGHDVGSVLVTNIAVKGDWPDIALPKDSPAFAIGFHAINTAEAGVYGDRAWRKRAAAN